MYRVYRSLNNDELLHGEYEKYNKAMKEAIYLVKANLSRVVRVYTIHDIKTIVKGKNGSIFISGKPLTYKSR